MLEPTIMRNSGDCAIVCLKMLLGLNYDTVRAACPRRGDPSGTGMTTRQVQNVAKKLGTPLSLLPGGDYLNHPSLDDLAGILDLWRGGDEDGTGHMALYLKGIVFNPADGSIWLDDDAYLRHGRWVVQGLLYRKEGD